MERPLDDTSAAELTLDARLPIPGGGIGSERMLRRTRFGIGVSPAPGAPLRIGMTLPLLLGT